MIVQCLEEVPRPGEIPEQVDLGEEQGDVLVVFPPDRHGTAAIDADGVADDVFIEGAEESVGQFRPLDGAVDEETVVERHVLRVPGLCVGVFELVVAKIVEITGFEQFEDPLLEDELLVELQRSGRCFFGAGGMGREKGMLRVL